MALTILSLALNRGLIRRLFNNRLMLFLGLISYSLYLWHYPIVSWFSHSELVHFIEGYRLPYLVLFVVPVIVVISAASYYFVERPFLLIRKNSPEKGVAIS